MPKKWQHHTDPRLEQRLAQEYPAELAASRARGLRTLEDFSPDELAQLQAKLQGWVAARTKVRRVRRCEGEAEDA